MVAVSRLELRDFRNYEQAHLAFGASVTAICGPNGAGKTNLLEALYFGCTGRSCRTTNERELVRIGQRLTRVAVQVEASDGPHRLDVGFQPGEAKRFRIDDGSVDRAPARGVRPLLGVFMPERLDLVKGPPALRRSHLDQLVAAMWPAASDARANYARALAQRNALLGRIRAGTASPALLEPWDAELARHGIALMDARRRAVAELAAPFAELADELGFVGRGAVEYRPRSRAGDADALRAELGARYHEDLARGFTGHGPHRDDLALLRDGRVLRSYGSQGQQRTAVLALLFAERELLGRRGNPPVMLLDDVMSELDSARRGRLADLIGAGGQVLLTATEPEHVPGAGDGGAELVFVADGTIAAAEVLL